MNKTFLVGNLGADPELVYVGVNKDKPVCNMRLATNEGWTDQEGNHQERTDWHRIIVWGNRAKACAEHLAKGRMIAVEGKLRTRSYQVEGEEKPRFVTEIHATDVKFLGGKKQQSGQVSAPQPAQTAQSSNADQLAKMIKALTEAGMPVEKAVQAAQGMFPNQAPEAAPEPEEAAEVGGEFGGESVYADEEPPLD